MNAATPTLEFLRVAQLAKQTTGLTPAADTSTHDSSGLWQFCNYSTKGGRDFAR